MTAVENDAEQPELLESKLLVIDDAKDHFDDLKLMCGESGLVGIRPLNSSKDSVLAILSSNVDLGGILIYEHSGGPFNGLSLAREIRKQRPELPIFMRRDECDVGNALGETDAEMIAGTYTINTVSVLKSKLEESIFSREYPNALVRGLTEISLAALETLFKGCTISVATPYLIRDRIIYGEVFSLIALESGWCRGYMMMQTDEDHMLAVLGENAKPGVELGFRDMNSVLGEATNLVWGAFKNRYAGFQDNMEALTKTQVPIIINHLREYISFGSDDSQLCLKYTITKETANGPLEVSIYQRFIFNLTWAPEAFTEVTVGQLVDLGELELF